MSNSHAHPDDRETRRKAEWLYTSGQEISPPPEGLQVKRTGHVFSIASSEYQVTFPDGTTATIWSPPWHDFTREQDELAVYI